MIGRADRHTLDRSCGRMSLSTATAPERARFQVREVGRTDPWRTADRPGRGRVTLRPAWSSWAYLAPCCHVWRDEVVRQVSSRHLQWLPPSRDRPVSAEATGCGSCDRARRGRGGPQTRMKELDHHPLVALVRSGTMTARQSRAGPLTTRRHGAGQSGGDVDAAGADHGRCGLHRLAILATSY